jgi:hypothetical protein
MRSYVCLFSTKIGYSLSTTPNVICNFLSMSDISGATLEDPGSTVHHSECSFVIQVQQPSNDKADSVSVYTQSCRNLPNDADPSGKMACGLSKSIAGDSEIQQPRFEPQPYHLQASSIAERDQWMNAINTALRAYQRTKEEEVRKRGSALRICQLRLRSFYNGLLFQSLTALLVAVNFFVTVSALCPLGQPA